MPTSKVPAGMLIRLRAGETPMGPQLGEGRHAAHGLPNGVLYAAGVGYRDPGDYMGLHRVDHAIEGDLVVVPFHDGPARLVELTRTAVSA